MKAPILIMAASPTCAPGWYEVPGASPPRGQDAAWALVLPSLVPLDVGGLLATGQVAGLAACLPPEGFEPPRYQREPETVRPVELTERFFGFWFSCATIGFAREKHPGIRWAPGGADGVGAIGEVDLLHGWAARRCVAVVGRLAPTPPRPLLWRCHKGCDAQDRDACFGYPGHSAPVGTTCDHDCHGGDS